jgi:hypothetical protein
MPLNPESASEIASNASALVVTKTMELTHSTAISAHLITAPATFPIKEKANLAIFVISQSTVASVAKLIRS